MTPRLPALLSLLTSPRAVAHHERWKRPSGRPPYRSRPLRPPPQPLGQAPQARRLRLRSFAAATCRFLLSLASACDAASTAPPTLELYIAGALTVTAPTLTFPDTPLDASPPALTIEIKNLGPGPAELSSTPPFILDRDDRLAFRVSQPASRTLPAGETLAVTVRFVAPTTGPSTARLLIAFSHLDEPLAILLAGVGTPPARPALDISLAQSPLPPDFDFGPVPTNAGKDVQLRFTNNGNTRLDLGQSPVTLDSQTSAFALGPLSRSSLDPGQSATTTLSFAPRACGLLRARLTIAVPAFDVYVVNLRGHGGDNPQRVERATDTALLRAPDLDVAISDPLDASPNGAPPRRRVAIGNLTLGAFAGQVQTFAHDGCTASEFRALSAASSGLSATLFGNQVALSDDGRTLLVSARDQRKDAWIYGLDPDGTARFQASLETFDEAFGHGRGAALSGDATVAAIGQTGATSGLNNHGAVFVYARPGSSWVSQPEAKLKLVPSNPVQTELIGAWVGVDRAGDVIASGALATPAGAATPGPALAYLWVRPTPTENDWGRPITEGEPNQRRENLRLLTAEVPADAAARIALSADASLVAIAVASTDRTRVHLFARELSPSSGSDPWGLPTLVADERIANAVLTFEGRPELRMTLAPDGSALLAGDGFGLLELIRPASGWLDRTLDADRLADRAWPAPTYGALALSPDATTLIGVSATGTAWILTR